MHLNEEEKQKYLKRSYAAVDGLWFMMIEEESGFDKALEIDKKVWEVMPKIQARFLKKAMGLGDGLENLKLCFKEKLELDGFDCRIDSAADRFTITLPSCPWHETMISSGREHLSSTIGNTICPTEYTGWAKEFGDDIAAEITGKICEGNTACTITFSRK